MTGSKVHVLTRAQERPANIAQDLNTAKNTEKQSFLLVLKLRRADGWALRARPNATHMSERKDGVGRVWDDRVRAVHGGSSRSPVDKRFFLFLGVRIPCNPTTPPSTTERCQQERGGDREKKKKTLIGVSGQGSRRCGSLRAIS